MNNHETQELGNKEQLQDKIRARNDRAIWKYRTAKKLREARGQ